MRWRLSLLIMGLLGHAVLAADNASPLQLLLDKSEVVVLGKFTSDVAGASDEPGVVHYQGEFKIEQLIKGGVLGQRRVGGTIPITALRHETLANDRSGELKRGARAILFLTCNERQSPPAYLVSDNWLGIQPPSSTLAKALAEMAKGGRPPSIAGLSAAGRQILEQVQPIEVAQALVKQDRALERDYRLDQAAVHAYCPPQPTKYDWLVSFPSRGGENSLLVAVTNDREAWRLDPQSLQRLAVSPAAADSKDARVQLASANGDRAPQRQPPEGQLAGNWRMFLPGGYDYAFRLTANKDQRYQFAPSGYVFGANYVVEGDFLVSAADDAERGEAKRGVFKWKIQSPYLLTLVEQPANSSSDYLGAVLFRPSPAAKLNLNREAAKGPGASLPRTTMEELDRIAESDYTLVREQMLGYQLESIGEVRLVSPSHPDWVVVDLPGKFWGATLRNVHADHGLQAGDKVRFRGLIVNEGYASLTIWVYKSDKARDYSDDGATAKFFHKQSFQFHPQTPRSDLELQLKAAETVERKQKHLVLPVTISNRTQHKIQAKLAQEWHGGLWPPTALYASVTRAGDPKSKPFQPVYRWGVSSEETRATVLAPNDSLPVELRMDWRGTGSVPAIPLMDEAGKYMVRFALVFEVEGRHEYVISPAQTVELLEAEQEK